MYQALGKLGVNGRVAGRNATNIRFFLAKGCDVDESGNLLGNTGEIADCLVLSIDDGGAADKRLYGWEAFAKC